MAKVHIYARSQAVVSDADGEAIAALMAQAQTIVEAAGGEWTGSVSVIGAEPVVVAAVEPEADAEPVKAKKRRW
jgi:regulator of extracellular matrix RemA (YlzA/DUF370 family)